MVRGLRVVMLVGAVGMAWGAAPVPGVSRAAKLKAEVMAADATVRTAARRDLINGEYRDLSDGERLAAIMEVIAKPVPADQQSDSMQGVLMEMLPRLAPSKAKEALPLLLGYMGDPKVDAYVRERAMFAAARIVPADERVVAALIKASSGEDPAGIFRDAVSGLGLMGAAAQSARPVLTKLLDGASAETAYLAYTSLGQILLDTTKEKDFVGAVGNMAARAEERAAGHLQLRGARTVTPGAIWTRTPTLEEKSAARAALLTVLQRTKADADARAALDTLAKIGAGSDPAMVQGILDNAEGYYEAFHALEAMEYTDDGAVPILVSGLRRDLTATSDWPMRIALANGLAHFGSKGRAIAPDLIVRLEKEMGAEHPDWLEMPTYLHLLGVLGADVPDVSAGLMRMLDRTAGIKVTTMKGQEYQGREVIVKALFEAGLPTEAGQRKVVLARMIKEASGAEFARWRGELVQKVPAVDLEPYAGGLAAQLTEVLKRPAPEETEALDAQLRESAAAVRGLVHLGKAAVIAKAQLQAIAGRDFMPYTYMRTPALTNELIRAAREALAGAPFGRE